MPPNQNNVAGQTALKVAIIGQSPFAVDVMERLISHGHKIVGVFTILDKGKREDPLAKAARESDIPCFKIKAWRNKGVPLPEILELYRSVNADLNVLPYCSQFIPMEVINYPRLKSICYHPSILPRHRGASSINWTLICGDKKAGLSIFWADDGLDTGPILLQEECEVLEDDTVDSLYKRFLYPVGISAVARAVDMVADGSAPKIAQSEKGATYDPMLNKPDLQKVDFSKTGLELYNFIRGMDSVPGASCKIRLPGTEDYQEGLLFGSSLWKGAVPIGKEVEIDGTTPGIIHEGGLLLRGSDGEYVNVKRVKVEGRMKNASTLDQQTKQVQIEYTQEEKDQIEIVRDVWEAILSVDVEDDTDFFASGAASMDVVRLVEEVKDIFKTDLENEDVFLAPVFSEFVLNVVLKTRGAGGKMEIEYRPIELDVNRRKIKFPCQLFINGEFIDAALGFIKIREKLAELEKTSDKRKEERKKAFKDKDRDDDYTGRRFREHYVGGRELDRRSRRHRSKSRERRDNKDKKDKGDRDNKERGGDNNRDRTDRKRSRSPRSRDRSRRSHSHRSGSNDKRRDRE